MGSPSPSLGKGKGEQKERVLGGGVSEVKPLTEFKARFHFKTSHRHFDQ